MNQLLTINLDDKYKPLNLPTVSRINQSLGFYSKYFDLTWDEMFHDKKNYDLFRDRLHNYLLHRNKDHIEKFYDIFQSKLKDTPVEGEFLILKDGTLDRFTYAWKDGIQIGGTRGSFYFAGYCSYSGTLNPSVKYSDLILTDKIEWGTVWIFDQDQIEAHNSFQFKLPFRVWKFK